MGSVWYLVEADSGRPVTCRLTVVVSLLATIPRQAGQRLVPDTGGGRHLDGTVCAAMVRCAGHHREPLHTVQGETPLPTPPESSVQQVPQPPLNQCPFPTWHAPQDTTVDPLHA